jgi:predicted metal-dependent RNase
MKINLFTINFDLIMILEFKTIKNKMEPKTLYKNIEEMLKKSSKNPLIKEQAEKIMKKKLDKKVVLGFYGGFLKRLI